MCTGLRLEVCEGIWFTMPPALEKTLEKDRRIHVSPPVLTRDADSSQDMDNQITIVDGSYARFWLNLASFSIIDTCSVKKLPGMVDNSTSHKPDLQCSLGPLLRCASMNESSADCPMIHEFHSGFQSRNLRQNLMLSSLPNYQRESEPRSSASGFSDRSIALNPVWHSGSHSALQEDMEARRTQLASQHRVLASRTERTKLRLHALLGENALQTFNKQLEELSRKLPSHSPTSTKTHPDTRHPAENMCVNGLGTHEEAGCFSNKSSGQTFNSSTLQQGNAGSRRSSKVSSMEKSSESIQLLREIHSLTQCGQAVLHDARRALDSDATESSSDDEWDKKTTRNRPSSWCLGCEFRDQHDRAKLASQWTWMKLRLSELDLQIKKVSQLHQNLLANKGGVVLAEAQPLTDLQIQQTLLTETAGLTLTAGHKHDLNSELDTEPSSPTRLLRNIERQSAQLSQIVNSLMSPLSEMPSRCPVDKGDSRCWRGSRKRSFYSPANDVFLHTGSTCIGETNLKKRRASRRGLLRSQVDVSRVCARTRPLLTYHKPRLFIMDQSGVTQKGAETAAYRCSSSTSCDPMSVCSKPVPANTINGMFRPNKISVSRCVRAASFVKEDWLHHPRPIVLSPSVTAAKKRTPSIFNCVHDLQAAGARSKATKDTPTQTCRQAVKRRLQRRTDVDTFSPRDEDGLEDVSAPYSTNLHETSQFAKRRRSDESIYNINNIVIPTSLAASSTVEKLNYKDIPTPSWRVVELSPLVETEVDFNKTESLSDDVFIQRHQIYERREKLCWNSWEKGRRFTYKTRSPSSPDTSPDRAPTPAPRLCNTPTDTQQDTMDEAEEPQPWERRMFPLINTHEETLRCNEDEPKVKNLLCLKNEETEPSLSDCPCKNSVSCSAHTPPPGGHRRNNKSRTASPPPHPDNMSTMHHRNRGLRNRK